MPKIVDYPETDEYWIVLRDITDSERAAVKLRSDVEYLAMMTGVEL